MTKIGFIGGGNMAEALIKGMVSQGMKDIIVHDINEERLRHLEENYGVKSAVSNPEVVSSSEIVVLAVKPQNMESVLEEISPAVTEESVVVSIAAGITLGYLSSRLKTRKLIRVMPNTPALVQEGMSVISLCECFTDHAISAVREIFMSVGKVITLPERHMDAVTALSGSGPAFIARFIEAMIDAGVEMGMTRDDAYTLGVQTAIGTAGLLKSGMSPSRLREMVTSPGGTTAAGLDTFEKRGLRDIVRDALFSAEKRSKELGRS